MKGMHLQNEINRIGVNINQIVKNNNSHMYSENDRIKLQMQMDIVRDLFRRNKFQFCVRKMI